MHTISAPGRRQELGSANPLTLILRPKEEEHLPAAWHGNAICANNVPHLQAGPITHARPALALGLAQRRRHSLMWVVCMFSPADTHIVFCDPQLPGPGATTRMAECASVVVKALKEGDHYAFLLHLRL